MATANPPAYHCIVCTLTKIPFASLSKESQQKIVRNGRPTPKMRNLTSRCLNSLNLNVHDWMTGCDRDRKLYCWPCLLFNTSEYDVWGKRGFGDFYRLSLATIDHTKDVSHQAKSKTLKLWTETACEQSDSSGAEEDVECIPELDFLNASASELDEEIDVKPNVEALNAAIGFSQHLSGQVVDLCETAEDGSGMDFSRTAAINANSQELGENSRTSNASSSAAGQGTMADDLARIYKTPFPEVANPMMSQSVQNGTEKYQLKWHSHHQNMNVSLSNLYKNDRYADVMLLTCSGEESYAIPAHKLILGTSSLYFANIFDKNAVPTNAITYIVLPPDLTHRSMQILIQYMYTGESTVSTDILNEVLRGGDILKIRGLWRNDCSKTASNASDGNKEHPLGESASRFVSPVTVNLPQVSPAPVFASGTGLINIKRDVAIDPGERRRTGSADDGIRRSYKNQENILHPNGGDPSQQQAQPRNHSPLPGEHSFPVHEHPRRSAKQEAENVGNSTPNSSAGPPPGGASAIPAELNFLNVKAEPVEWMDVRAGELPQLSGAVSPAGQKAAAGSQSAELQVKVEAESGADHSRPSSSSSAEQPTYSPLTCELCAETFTVPGEWVRHIEGHGDTSHALPKRRRRTEESEDADITAALRCDLCATFYVTPADWVRHVQSAHTETELAISNKRQAYPRYGATSNSTHHQSSPTTAADDEPGAQQQDKLCTVCNKSFPSCASMIVHRRTHTGEKPFYCDTCNKGFNVKSNLLRHLRTLHNQHGELPASPHTDAADSHGSE
ncbi:zinc finger and BTB domain-containing protein 18-like [Anopheles cruzii]|uniref:zinc finger and BTB domain-containing protein 18-like n=1 Tax=Anopheles cruzii TaxID=68878 RepID=UPI0022EC81D4|nr:zinc finger and BTB domain-containing protein 18-like [Anopheles cruzii]XP_052870753.1 zinc finger and BTB domain-containing protein 18-like [Anopheles cruzii]